MSSPFDSAAEAADLLDRLGVARPPGDLKSSSPIDGRIIGSVAAATADAVSAAGAQAEAAFLAWRRVPAPRRGELIRIFGDILREAKVPLARLVSVESGKLLSEGQGEVQEMIDICDFAVGLSRQLYGLTIASERPAHRMMETWHPLGPVAIISAFNFPVAVWAWNACLALVCGNSLVWKPSEKTPLVAAAVQDLFERAASRFGDAPPHLSQIVQGDAVIGSALAADPRIALVSATGSTRMGRAVGPVVSARFGRSLLELGGNNAMIVAPSADLELAVRAIAFAAAGTAGQRCTSLRRLIVHRTIHADLVPRLRTIFAGLSVGNPLEEGVLVGPLIDADAFHAMQSAIAAARDAGANVSGGERMLANRWPGAFYVRPAIAEHEGDAAIIAAETFAPLLHVLAYDALDQAIAINNKVPQGLSSSIFTNDLREAEAFLSATGSDCGIANVNIGPSGAEIGGAFGGEKETGGGRESGSDSWRAYMRRATNTINYGGDLPLAQGVDFSIP